MTTLSQATDPVKKTVDDDDIPSEWLDFQELWDDERQRHDETRAISRDRAATCLKALTFVRQTLAPMAENRADGTMVDALDRLADILGGRR